MLRLMKFVPAFLLLLSACSVNRAVLPSPKYPHALAKDVKVIGWCKVDEDTWEKCRIQLRAGDLVASREALYGEK